MQTRVLQLPQPWLLAQPEPVGGQPLQLLGAHSAHPQVLAHVGCVSYLPEPAGLVRDVEVERLLVQSALSPASR